MENPADDKLDQIVIEMLSVFYTFKVSIPSLLFKELVMRRHNHNIHSLMALDKKS